jgi:hypothetical protein
MLYVCGDMELGKSVTRRWTYRWRDGDGETGYLAAPVFHLLRVLRLVRRHPMAKL